MKYLASLIFLLLFNGCPDEVNTSLGNPLRLVIEDVTCTEVFLKLTLPSSEQNRTVTLKRSSSLLGGDSTILVVELIHSDSLILDGGLLPNKNYTYTLSLNNWTISAQATTMDTTSHDWQWTTDRFGISSSYLYDVAIINDSLAYAVGEIYTMDSAGIFDNNAYNLAKWDGKKWTLMRVWFNTVCGQPGKSSYPASAIFAVNDSDIWIAQDGSQIAQWNGRTEPTIMCLPVSFSITKIWASHSNDVYVIGHNVSGGIILHFDGLSWKQIQSGTLVNLNDIWGETNGDKEGPNNSDIVVLLAAGNKLGEGEDAILRIINGTVDRVPWNSSNRTRQSIWFDKNGNIFSCGSGVFRSLKNNWINIDISPAIYTNRIRGNDVNDIVVVGDFGVVGHYNGMHWKIYNELKLPNGNYESVFIKGNIVVATGWYGGRGYAVIGKRSQ